MARAHADGPRGIEDLVRSVELAERANSPDALHTSLNNLANVLWQHGELDRASAALARAREAAERFGNSGGLVWLDIEDMLDRELRGDWDEALTAADAFLAQMADSRHYLQGPARDVRMLVLIGRGDVETAQREAELLLAHARAVQGEQIAPALADVARVLVAAGRRAEADTLISEVLEDHRDALGSHWLRELPLLLAELGRSDEYLAAVADLPRTLWLEAGASVARGELLEGADAYERLGARGAEAWARLLAAEALAARGLPDEAHDEAGRALAYFRKVRAAPYVRRGEALLVASPRTASGGGGPSASIS
jgi:hypothetical protein